MLTQNLDKPVATFSPNLPKIISVVRWLLVMVGVAFLAIYVVLAFFRIQYPYELEFLEGGMVDVVKRVAASKPLYVAPTLEYTPYIYGPFYFYLAAVVSNLFGVSFATLRVISFVCSLGCFVLIYLLVKKQTGSWFAGLMAMGLFAATFRISGAWLDLARVDSLFLLLLLGGFYLVRFYPSAWVYIGAGVLFFLSFLTKQTALLIAAPVMLYAVLQNWKRALWLIGTVLVLVIGSTIWLNGTTEGWYLYYTWDLPRNHPLDLQMLFYFWSKDLLLPLAITAIFATIYLSAQFLKKPTRQSEVYFYLLFLAGMLAGSWLSRLHTGGYDNDLIPADAGMAVFFGLAIPTIIQFLKELPKPTTLFLEGLLYLGCLLQFVVLSYNPIAQLPTKTDLAVGQNLIAQIANIKGSVFIPYHGELASMAGKDASAQGMAISDVLRGDKGPNRDKLIAEIRQAIQNHQFAALILDADGEVVPLYEDLFQADINKYYTKAQILFSDPNSFMPVTGQKTRPEFIYVPK